jgi:hypothetical protein
MKIPSVMDGWTNLNLLSDSELLDLANHLDNLNRAKKLHPDEQEALDLLEAFDLFVGGLRYQYRQRVIKKV